MSCRIPILILLLLAFPRAGRSEPAGWKVEPLDEEQRSAYRLDAAFYKKGTRVQGILIATSERVSDTAHLEAAYQFDLLMRNLREDIARRIRERKVLCLLVGHDELTSDMPQFKTDKKGKELDFYNWRKRGFLTWVGPQPIVLFSEEDVLEYPGGMQLESILIHEFGHVIERVGFDDALKTEMKEAFQAAKDAGIWNDGRAAQRFRRVRGDTPVNLLDALAEAFPGESRALLEKCLDGGDILVNGKPTRSGVAVSEKDEVLIVFGGAKQCYAGLNRSEYWAEGVQCWYDTNRIMDHDHNHIHTRAQLIPYDPGLAALCEKVLGKAPTAFVSPRQRAGKGHLAEYRPEEAPQVVDPEHIRLAALEYYDRYWKPYWPRLYKKHGLERPSSAKAKRETP